MPKRIFNIDERDLDVFRRVCTIMYIITIYALIGVLTYRQFALGQPAEHWNDIALIVSFNILIALGALLYIGGVINPLKWGLGKLIVGYFSFLVLGTSFTLFKYGALLGQDLSLAQAWDHFLTVFKVSAIIAIALAAVAILGHRRVEKQLE